MKIAFGYKMRSGKDTSVDYLIKKYGGNKVTFAKPLYDALYKVQDTFHLQKEKDRTFLQLVGDWARNKDENIFVDLALKSKIDGNNFCNDLRFLNEFYTLKKDGWICVKILKNTGLISNHKSENELNVIKDEEWDYIIDNNGSFDQLYDQLDTIIERRY